MNDGGKKIVDPAMADFGKLYPAFSQWAAILGISSERSLTVKSVNPIVWVERTADGRIAVSSPQADKIGSATVNEHWPTQEISCIVKILL